MGFCWVVPLLCLPLLLDSSRVRVSVMRNSWGVSCTASYEVLPLTVVGYVVLLVGWTGMHENRAPRDKGLYLDVRSGCFFVTGWDARPRRFVDHALFPGYVYQWPTLKKLMLHMFACQTRSLGWLLRRVVVSRCYTGTFQGFGRVG